MKSLLLSFILVVLAGLASQAQYELMLEGRTLEINEDLYKEVHGSPYFNEWRQGHIITADGSVYKNLRLRYNAFSNQLQYREGNAIYSPAAQVKEFSLRDGSHEAVFRKGFPATRRSDEKAYYRVIFEGNLTLLKLIRKLIIEKRDPFSAGVIKTFTEVGDYYVFDKKTGRIGELSLNKKVFFRVFGAKEDQVRKWSKANKATIKNEAGLVRIFGYYENL